MIATLNFDLIAPHLRPKDQLTDWEQDLHQKVENCFAAYDGEIDKIDFKALKADITRRISVVAGWDPMVSHRGVFLLERDKPIDQARSYSVHYRLKGGLRAVLRALHKR